MACRSLIDAMLFDRVINVRRAASAAFQENVGRQGADEQHFASGIEILTLCDYFAVGRRTQCYGELAPRVAAIDLTRYGRALVAHLVHHKTAHWDPCVSYTYSVRIYI